MKEILTTSSVLILALLVMRLVFAKKVRRTLIYAAWALVALRLLIPVQIGQMDFSVLTAAKPLTETVAEFSQLRVIGQNEREASIQVTRDYIERDQTVFTPEVQEYIRAEQESNTPTEEIATAIVKTQGSQMYVQEVRQQVAQKVAEQTNFVSIGELAAGIWLAGVAAMTVWFAIVNLRHGRMLRRGREKLEWEGPIPVFVSEKVASPCLAGIFRPVIYLTAESAEKEETRRHVLTHELTHYRHGDHIWSLVRCICLCVYWFHPLVWVAAWFSRRDCELACDEGALSRLGEGERIAYGKSLLDVVRHAAAPAHLMQTATSMNETKQQLKQRVDFIVKKPKWSIVAAICMVLICAIVTGCATGGPVNGQQTGEETTDSTAPPPTEQRICSLTKIVISDTHVANSGTISLLYDEMGTLTEICQEREDGKVTRIRVQVDPQARNVILFVGQNLDILKEWYEYDAAGRLINRTYYSNNRPVVTEEYSYNAAGNLEKKVETNAWDDALDPYITERYYFYDDAAKLVEETSYQHRGHIGQEGLEFYLRFRYEYRYDTQGRLSWKGVYDYAYGDQLRTYWQYQYDSQTNTLRVENIRATTGRVIDVTVTEYDAAGNPIRTVFDDYPEEPGLSITTTTYTYEQMLVSEDWFGPNLFDLLEGYAGKFSA